MIGDPWDVWAWVTSMVHGGAALSVTGGTEAEGEGHRLQEES